MTQTYTYTYVTGHELGDGFVLIDGDPGFSPVTVGDRFAELMTHDTIEHMKGIGDNGFQNELAAHGAVIAGRYGYLTGITEDGILSGITSVLEAIPDWDDDTIEDEETGITIGLQSVLDALHTETGPDFIVSDECKEFGLLWLNKSGSHFKALTYDETLSLELVTLIIAHIQYGYGEFLTRCNGTPSHYPFDTVMSAFNTGMEDIKTIMNHRCIDEFWQGFEMVLTVSDNWYSADLNIHPDTLSDIDLDYPDED
jgi:hypothetical protein